MNDYIVGLRNEGACCGRTVLVPDGVQRPVESVHRTTEAVPPNCGSVASVEEPTENFFWYKQEKVKEKFWFKWFKLLCIKMVELKMHM